MCVQLQRVYAAASVCEHVHCTVMQLCTQLCTVTACTRCSARPHVHKSVLGCVWGGGGWGGIKAAAPAGSCIASCVLQVCFRL